MPLTICYAMLCYVYFQANLYKLMYLFSIFSFSGVDGKLLAELATIRATAPDTYFSIMRDENKMAMIDLLKFNSSLSELT